MVWPWWAKVTMWSQSHRSAGWLQPGKPQTRSRSATNARSLSRGPVGVGAAVQELSGGGVDGPPDPVPVPGHGPGHRGRDGSVAGDLPGVVGQPEQGRQVDHHGRGLGAAAGALRHRRCVPPCRLRAAFRRRSCRCPVQVPRVGRGEQRVGGVGAAVVQHGVHQDVQAQRADAGVGQAGLGAGGLFGFGLGGQRGPQVPGDGGRHGGPVGLHRVQLRHPLDGSGRVRLLVPVRRRGRVDRDHRPGHGAPELRHGLLRRPPQHPGLHRGWPRCRRAPGPPRPGARPAGRRCHRPPTPPAWPAAGGAARSPPRSAHPRWAGTAAARHRPRAGPAPRPAHAPRSRPRPRTAPAAAAPSSIARHRSQARIRSTRPSPSNVCGSIDASSPATDTSTPAPPSATAATNVDQPPDSARTRVPSSCTAIAVVMPET